MNGRQVEGPLYVVQKSVLGEVSFVALGADDATSARVAATQAAMTSEDRNMFEQWVEAQGFDSADLTTSSVRRSRQRSMLSRSRTIRRLLLKQQP